jgi:hypothetical protein
MDRESLPTLRKRRFSQVVEDRDSLGWFYFVRRDQRLSLSLSIAVTASGGEVAQREEASDEGEG